ncbi:hypothetical protein Tco_0228583 [Tanacetum coccineum]
MFYQNCPFLPSYNNQNAFYQSPTGLYRPTMDTSNSFQANQPYSPLNRINLDMDFEQLLNTQEYYQSQDYSMGQGSAHGSAPVDDDDSSVEEMSPVKNALKRPSRDKKNDGKTTKGRKKSKTSEITSGSASGGFNLNDEADEYEEAREHRPLGHDAAKAKNKSFASSRGGSYSFVDLVADKYLKIKSTKWERMQEQQDSYI